MSTQFTSDRKERNRKVALDLAARGLKVFALSGGKVPFRGSHGHLDASSDEAAVAEMMARPSAVPGLAPSDAQVVVDIDPRNGGTCESVGLAEADADVRTPGGGWHFYFAQPEPPLKLKAGILPGVDVKARGGYVVAPGAVLADGREYDGSVPDAWPLMPDATLATLRAATDSRDSQPVTDDDGYTARGEVLHLAGRLRAAGADAADLRAALRARLDDGRIYDSDPSDPWTYKDLDQIASDIGSKPLDVAVRYATFGVRLLGFYDARKAAMARAKERPVRLAAAPTARLLTVSARDLLANPPSAPIEVIPGLVPAGLSAIVAKPKIGKSWLAYQAAIAVATGGEILGRRASRGDVLYLALEDGAYRAFSRIQSILQRTGTAWPADAELDVTFVAGRGEEMVAQVEEWLSRHPAAALVIVDTLQKVRPASSGRRNAYELDVEDVGRVQAITQRHPGLAVHVVHHDRKEKGDDFIDAASGTHGLTGSLDTILVLKRGRHEVVGTLEVTGRDVKESLLHLAYDPDAPFWSVDPLGGLSGQERAAWDWLRHHGPAGPTTLGDALEMDRSNASRLLRGMADAGYVVSSGQGTYTVPFSTTQAQP